MKNVISQAISDVKWILDDFLKQNKITGIEGVDTRAITRTIRNVGTMRGIITLRGEDLTESQIKRKFESLNKQKRNQRRNNKRENTKFPVPEDILLSLIWVQRKV